MYMCEGVRAGKCVRVQASICVTISVYLCEGDNDSGCTHARRVQALIGMCVLVL